jgi:uncharacterized protein (DUF1330 family)
MSGYIDPSREHFKAFKDLPRDTPIHMLNLIRLGESVNYPEGFDGPQAADCAAAYAAYGEHSGPIFRRVGGQIIWRGQPETLVIGPQDERWDLAFIAVYPNAGAFLEMVTDPVYQTEAVPHRQAAVADSRLIRHLPLDGGAGFG